MAFICQFASGSYSAVGSLERPARWITASTPSRALAGMSRTSASIDLDAVEDRRDRAAAPVEPVEDADVVAAVQQALRQDGADVAGAAGDEDELPGLGRLGREPVGAARERRQLHVPVAILTHASKHSCRFGIAEN